MIEDPLWGVYKNVKVNAKAFFVFGAKRFSLKCPSCMSTIIIDNSAWHEKPQLVCFKCNTNHKILGTKWFKDKIILTIIKD
jgi:hypothetical protein